MDQQVLMEHPQVSFLVAWVLVVTAIMGLIFAVKLLLDGLDAVATFFSSARDATRGVMHSTPVAALFHSRPRSAAAAATIEQGED